MKPLTIELVKGQKQEFTVLGWKEDGLSFFATRMNGRPAMIIPVSAYPHDSDSGQPYRFPRIDPLEITPKRFEITLSDHDRDVWREARLAAEVHAGTQAYPQPSRTPAEINRRQQEIKDAIERRYRELMETPLVPLVKLFDPIAVPYVLEDFWCGRWADDMGEDFRARMDEARQFDWRWHRAYNWEGKNYQSMLSALSSVKYVMRGDDNVDYHLHDVKVRPPTNVEAEEYLQMQPLLGGKSRRRQGERKPAPCARFENDFSVAVIPERKGKLLRLPIELELRSLVKRIIDAGGTIPRITLRKDQPDTYQPEKLLRSKIAKSLMKAGLLGYQRTGRASAFWATIRSE